MSIDRREFLKITTVGSVAFLIGCSAPQKDCQNGEGVAGAVTICADSKGRAESGSFATTLKPDRLITDPEYVAPFQITGKDFFILDRRTLSPSVVQTRVRLQTITIRRH